MWDVCRLSQEAAARRRRGALEALGPLIRLLGGKTFSRSGIHQPLLNEASLSVSLSDPACTVCKTNVSVCPSVSPQTFFCCEGGIAAKKVNAPVSSQEFT